MSTVPAEATTPVPTATPVAAATTTTTTNRADARVCRYTACADRSENLCVPPEVFTPGSYKDDGCSGGDNKAECCESRADTAGDATPGDQARAKYTNMATVELNKEVAKAKLDVEGKTRAGVIAALIEAQARAEYGGMRLEDLAAFAKAEGMSTESKVKDELVDLLARKAANPPDKKRAAAASTTPAEGSDGGDDSDVSDGDTGPIIGAVVAVLLVALAVVAGVVCHRKAKRSASHHLASPATVMSGVFEGQRTSRRINAPSAD